MLGTRFAWSIRPGNDVTMMSDRHLTEQCARKSFPMAQAPHVIVQMLV